MVTSPWLLQQPGRCCARAVEGSCTGISLGFLGRLRALAGFWVQVCKCCTSLCPASGCSACFSPGHALPGFTQERLLRVGLAVAGLCSAAALDPRPSEAAALAS